MKNLICALIATTSLFACAADDPAPAAEQTTPATHADPPDSAVATLLKGGDYRFALADSEVLSLVKGTCAEQPDPEACLQAARVEAEGEGVQIEALGGDRVHYLSYVTAGGERRAHVEANVTVAPTDEPGIVELVDPEVIRGPELPPQARILIEVVSEDTIAMDKALGHPRTGGKRLVFHRAPR